MLDRKNKTPIKVFAGVIVMVTLSCLKAYVLMPYVYAAFHYDLYNFSCAIVPVFIAMSGMCFLHLANVCDISYTRKSNYPLFILAVAAIIEALIFLAFLASPQFFNYIFAFQQTIWSPPY